MELSKLGAEVGDIIEGETAKLLGVEVDTQEVKMLEAEEDIQDTQGVRRHTW